MPTCERAAGIREFLAALDIGQRGAAGERPCRVQCWIVPGHKADFGIMAVDPSPHRVDALHQRLVSGRLGPAIVPTYSFVSLTEVSEYVPSVEQYAQRLIEEGETADSPAYKAKV